MRRAVALVVLALVGASCGGDDGLDVSARFADVGDLAASAPVMLADVPIGKVEDIVLEDGEATVTMSIDDGIGVPQGVTARIRRTSLLGERVVDLVVPEGLPANAPMLEDGAVIERTETRADLEDLVLEGSDVLAPISASEIATLVEEGAEGFGGHGKDLRKLLGNFSEIVQAYSGRTDQLRSVIESLDQFNSIIASQAEAQARSIENSAQAVRVLREEADRLEVAIRALDRLSRGGRSILEEHSDEMARFFRQMRAILDVLNSEQDSIVRILRWAPKHNQNTQWTEHRDFVQVYQDLIVCGLNDDPDDPARRCKEGAQ